ncbi:MAG: class II aldolase/adducin family protein [Myxococcaceae bacterium]
MSSVRVELLKTAKELNPRGLNQGTSGNASARSGAASFLVTPTGVSYDALSDEDLVELNLDGSARTGKLAPSSEWRIHRDLYAQRSDVGAVVHVHSMFATTLACLRKGIPAMHYMVAAAGGNDIRCARYETYGTEELSRAVLDAMQGRKACLMANHGMLAVGPDLASALKLAVEVETLAAQYWRALQIGEPHILDDAEMARVHERFRSYGQSKKR